MNDRARFEAQELREMADQHGGERVNLRGGGGYYRFKPLWWCCPGNVQLRLTVMGEPSDPRSWYCPNGCPRWSAAESPNICPIHRRTAP